MKKVILFLLSLSFLIPCNVFAIDDPGFEFPCEFIPEKGYINQNNGDHGDDSSYYWITERDTDNLYTSNTYKIGNKYYRALKYRNISTTSNSVFSMQFEIYPNTDFDAWKYKGMYWKTNGYYIGYLMLGTTNGHYFDYAGGSDSVVSRVGTLYTNEKYYVRPQDYVSKVQMKSNRYYDNESGLYITMLPFSFKTMGKDSSNNVVFTLEDKNPNLMLGDVFVLGFSLMPSTEQVAQLDNVPNGTNISYDELNNERNYFRGDRCFVGTLDSDNSSPEEAIECDGIIDCTIKEIESGLSKFVDSLLNFLNKLFIPDGEIMNNMCTSFMEWFDKKLGFLGQPITFTVDFLNRFLNIKDTGHYVIKVNDIKDPIFNLNIINGFEFDFASLLENEKLNRMHTLTFIIINGSIGIAFLMLCGKKADDIFGQSHDTNGESLSEYEGYDIDDETGSVSKKTHRFVKKTSYKKDGLTERWKRK